jgi:hypothetical protein
MIYVLFIIISGLLYRMPRGTQFMGSSTLGRVIWAAPTAIFAPVIFWDYYLIELAACFLYLWLAVIFVEKADADYGPQPEARKETSLFMMTLKGCLLFNPFLGLVNIAFYAVRDRLKPLTSWLTGWSEYAELTNGLITALSFFVLKWYIVNFLV